MDDVVSADDWVVGEEINKALEEQGVVGVKVDVGKVGVVGARLVSGYDASRSSFLLLLCSRLCDKKLSPRRLAVVFFLFRVRSFWEGGQAGSSPFFSPLTSLPPPPSSPSTLSPYPLLQHCPLPSLLLLSFSPKNLLPPP